MQPARLLCVIVFEAVDDTGDIKLIPSSPAKRRVHAESCVDGLLRNGVAGHNSLRLFLAKAPGRKERNDGLTGQIEVLAAARRCIDLRAAHAGALAEHL